jgi:hypothetical protein
MNPNLRRLRQARSLVSRGSAWHPPGGFPAPVAIYSTVCAALADRRSERRLARHKTGGLSGGDPAPVTGTGALRVFDLSSIAITTTVRVDDRDIVDSERAVTAIMSARSVR